MKIIKILMFTFFFAVIAGVVGSKQGVVNTALFTVLSGIVGALTVSIYELVDTKGQGLKIWFQSQFFYNNSDI